MRVNQGRDKRVALNQPASRCQNRVLLILSNFPGSFLEFLTRVAQTAGSAVCGLSLAPPSQKQAPAQPETPRAKPENEPRTPESGVRATIQIKNEFVDSKQLPRFVPSFFVSIRESRSSVMHLRACRLTGASTGWRSGWRSFIHVVPGWGQLTKNGFIDSKQLLRFVPSFFDIQRFQGFRQHLCRSGSVGWLRCPGADSYPTCVFQIRLPP